MSRILIVTSLALGLMAGGTLKGGGTAPAGGGPQIAMESAAKCPLVYAPVICDGGKVYSNQCFADLHHAKNCHPLGI